MDNGFQFSNEEQELLERLGIAALVLFGSRAQGISRLKSDYDVGILLAENGVLKKPEQRNALYDELYEVLANHIKELANIA